MMTPFKLTTDNLEQQMHVRRQRLLVAVVILNTAQTNHISHFVLTLNLLGKYVW